MEEIKVVIRDARIFKDGKGEHFVVYILNITVVSPFHTWEEIRRFSDFQKLYNFMTSKSNRRHIDATIPSLSPAKHVLSYIDPRGEAKKRIPKLSKYINGLLSLPDLTMTEIDILKRFLNFEMYEMFLDMERNSDVRLSEDFGVPNTTQLEDITQVSKVLFLDEPQREERGISIESEISGDGVYPECSNTWRIVPGERNTDESPDVVCITSRSSDSLTTVETHSKSISSSSLPDAKASNRLPCMVTPDGKQRIYTVTSDGLKEAVRSNDVRGVKELLRMNPKLAAYSDSNGNPIIYSAALYGSVAMAILLIDAGADPYTVNRNGLCAFDIALEPWRHAVLEHMVKRKALIRNRESVVSLSLRIAKTSLGFGIKLGRNPDGHALIVGFKDMPTGQSNPAKCCTPPLEVCDVIISVNNMGSLDFEGTLEALQGIAVGSSVDIKIMRSLH